MVSHNGGDTGFLTGLAMLPEKKIAVVWMANAEWLPNTGAITHAALERWLSAWSSSPLLTNAVLLRQCF
jgi:hypothetical protein